MVTDKQAPESLLLIYHTLINLAEALGPHRMVGGEEKWKRIRSDLERLHELLYEVDWEGTGYD